MFKLSIMKVQFNKLDIVHGICPTCEEQVLLISLSMDFYKCVECGAELQQHVNGKISYLPVIHTTKKKNSLVKNLFEE